LRCYSFARCEMGHMMRDCPTARKSKGIRGGAGRPTAEVASRLNY